MSKVSPEEARVEKIDAPEGEEAFNSAFIIKCKACGEDVVLHTYFNRSQYLRYHWVECICGVIVKLTGIDG